MPRHQTGTTAQRISSRIGNEDAAARTVAVAICAPAPAAGLNETSTTGPRPDAAAGDGGMLHEGVRSPTTGAAAAQNTVDARIQCRTAADRLRSASAATMP